ncbi:MAG: type II toxin-antitoxin system RelB/DinJ family antitoxin [Rhizobiales bacterium]|nr:type II toxin-antitoxin system RelB/DinJ family antitoxin [Hyphomicrobiales bacterium]
MRKTAYITARVEPALKASAEGVLHKLGVSTTDAITMFLRQVTLRRGLPFDVRIPNSATAAAIAELEGAAGRKLKRYKSARAMISGATGHRRKKR